MKVGGAVVFVQGVEVVVVKPVKVWWDVIGVGVGLEWYVGGGVGVSGSGCGGVGWSWRWVG